MSANNVLPQMPNYIQQLTRQTEVFIISEDPAEIDDCSICSDKLVENENGSVKRMSPCGHFFHIGCIVNHLRSTSVTRNLCPNCRAPLCKLDYLTPEQAASRAAEEAAEIDEMPNFQHDAFARIVSITDDLFDKQWVRFRPTGREDYTRIAGEARYVWCVRGYENTHVCQEHVRMGWDYFDKEVARRLHERLFIQGATNSWAGQLFNGWFLALLRMIEERYFRQDNEENEASVESAEDEVHEEQPQEDDGNSTDVDMRNEREMLLADLLSQIPDVKADENPVQMPGHEPVVQPSQPSSPAIAVAPRTSRRTQTLPAGAGRTPANPLPNPIPAQRSNAPAHQGEPMSTHESDSDTDSDIDSDSVEALALPRRTRTSTRSRNRIVESHRDRELRQYRQSHFRQERRRLERHYDIIMELPDVGPIKPLGNMEFRVKNKAGIVIGVVKNVHGYSIVGDSAVFWRLKE
jgi:hypothetical protein